MGLWRVQEFCNGGSLRHGIAEGMFAPGALENHWDVVLHVLAQVADAVAYLHSKRICHGDLNPANVLFKVRTPLNVPERSCAHTLPQRWPCCAATCFVCAVQQQPLQQHACGAGGA
jgi:hypothetical protein